MLSWYVYVYDRDQKKIEKKNIFKGGHWQTVVDALMHQCRTKDEFAAKFKQKLMSVYWSRCEYEVVLATWPTYISREELERLNREAKDPCHNLTVNLTTEIKIDVFDQLLMNWPQFVDYVWNNA